MSESRISCEEQLNETSVSQSTNGIHKKEEIKYSYFDRVLRIMFPTILFASFFCLAACPYLAALSDPGRNLHRLHVLVADFDHSYVGEMLQDWIVNAEIALGSDRISFEYKVLLDESELQNRILYGQGWAAVYASSEASQRLSQSLENNCSNYHSYQSSQAYGFIIDEGRSSTSSKVIIQLQSVLPQLTTQMSSYLLQSMNSSQINGCVQNGAYTLLSNPVTYQTINITPVNVAPVGSGLTTIGNILVSVFSVVFFVNFVFRVFQPITSTMTNITRALYRACALIMFGCGISFGLASMIVGLAPEGVNHVYGVRVWWSLFFVCWLQTIIFSFCHATVAELISINVIPFPFIILLVSSVLGGWNDDLADIGYINFYQIFPFNWSNNLYKYILYGSLPNVRDLSIGILIAQAFLFITFFFCVSLRKEIQSMIDKGGDNNNSNNINRNSNVLKGHVPYDVVQKEMVFV